MMDKGRRAGLWCALALLGLFASGCAGTVKNMRVVPPGQELTAPTAGKALVVFLRPSGMGFAVQSSVFELVDKTPELVGIVAAKKKVAYPVSPGSHLFMVIGESADFMSADLEAGKTYYALVTPRFGWWKARFSLRAVHPGEGDGADLDEWLDECEWVELSPDSKAWAASHMTSIEKKYRADHPRWLEKAASDRPHLSPQDGR